LSNAGEILVNDLPKPLPSQSCQPVQTVAGIRLVAIIDHQRLTAHKRVRDESPITGVRRVIPVVAEHEVVMRRDD
jgi:hypothetical protein